MTQTAIVILIVGAALAWAACKVVRLLRGKGGGCHCGGSCSQCPHTGAPRCHCHDGRQ